MLADTGLTWWNTKFIWSSREDSVTQDFFNRHLTLRLCSCLLYLSIGEVFKWLMHAFKLVGWKSIGINTQYLSPKWFCGSILIGDRKGLKANINSFSSWSTTAWNNAFPSLRAMTSHTSWYASPAFWTNLDFLGKEHFPQQSTWDSKCVILGFCATSARLSIYAFKTWIGSMLKFWIELS